MWFASPNPIPPLQIDRYAVADFTYSTHSFFTVIDSKNSTGFESLPLVSKTTNYFSKSEHESYKLGSVYREVFPFLSPGITHKYVNLVIYCLASSCSQLNFYYIIFFSIFPHCSTVIPLQH